MSETSEMRKKRSLREAFIPGLHNLPTAGVSPREKVEAAT
jgi:hypothetical protein